MEVRKGRCNTGLHGGFWIKREVLKSNWTAFLCMAYWEHSLVCSRIPAVFSHLHATNISEGFFVICWDRKQKPDSFPTTWNCLGKQWKIFVNTTQKKIGRAHVRTPVHNANHL